MASNQAMSSKGLTQDQPEKGFTAFQAHEARDAMYKTAAFPVDHFWGRLGDMADSLGVLLLTCNQAHYRYWSVDFGKPATCIAKFLATLASYRAKSSLVDKI